MSPIFQQRQLLLLLTYEAVWFAAEIQNQLNQFVWRKGSAKKTNKDERSKVVCEG